MAKPNLTAVDFPTLFTTEEKFSDGTVTGTGITKSDKVTIKSKVDPKNEWEGKVGDPVQGEKDKFHARVKRKKKQHATETVGVTVTNSGNEESNEKETESNVVP
jgi:hypothetical protein